MAQSYRLLHAVLEAAVDDEVIPANPCKLRNAGTPKTARPSRALMAAEARALADHLGQDSRTQRYRALVLVLAFGGCASGKRRPCDDATSSTAGRDSESSGQFD